MTLIGYFLAALFLPLFPLSMAFNTVFARTRGALLRSLLLLAWPQAGVFMLTAAGGPVPRWLVAAALITSLLYGLRALALREVNMWAGFLATSAWALLWVPAALGAAPATLHLYAFGFSAPLALLVVLASELERRYGAAYTGLYGGLAHALPRLSGVLVFVVLAVIATPVFPGFSTLINVIVTALPVMPLVAAGLIGVWLLWSWAGARLLQGLIIGPAGEEFVPDLGRSTTWAYSGILVVLAVAGIYGMGDLT